MISLSLKMLVADMKRTMKGAWWLAPIIFALLCIIPFIEDIKFYSLGYFIVAMLSFFRPQFSRIHYILPLSEKQLKWLYVLRIAIISAVMLLAGGIIVGVCECLNWNWNKSGFMTLAFYIVLLLVCSETAFGEQSKKFQTRYISAIILAVASMLIGFGMFFDYLPYIWNLALACICVLVATFYMIYYLNKVEIGDFTYVPAYIGDDGKVERK